MPSPFPGFDPYLESPTFWSDFHSTFINYWRETIAETLPDKYEAGIGDRVYLVEPSEDDSHAASTIADRSQDDHASSSSEGNSMRKLKRGVTQNAPYFMPSNASDDYVAKGLW